MLVSLLLLHLQRQTNKGSIMSKKGTMTTADYLPFEDYKKLVQSLIDEKKYWWACYCILSFCTGLRFSDVSQLKWGDVLGKKHIVIQAKKTGKAQSIWLGENTQNHLEQLYNRMGKPNKSEIILKAEKRGKEGQSMSVQYINRVLKRWVIKYNLDIEHFSTHSFRKTFGRYVYEKSGRTNDSLLYLNRIFKHNNLDTTMTYLGIRDKEIASIFNSIEI